MSARQLPLPLKHRPSMAGEDFLVAAPNEAAVAWLERWPDWPTRGAGAAWPAGVRQDSSFACLSRSAAAAQSSILARSALVRRSIWPRTRRPASSTMPTRRWPLASRRRCCTCTILWPSAAAIFCSPPKPPPARWPIRLADLRSRLNTATPVGIAAPDDALIAGVLVKLFMDRRLAVADEVILYALPRMERSFAAARQLVADLDAAALGRRRKVTVSLLRDVLQASGEAA